MTTANLPSLIEWLKTKDPDETYLWSSVSLCVFAQYSQHLGVTHNAVMQAIGATVYFNIGRGDYSDKQNDWTFGWEGTETC
jgi:hypothetical protein